jgi:16S rRNA (cytosine1402-N4)-methyltransferase
MRMDKGSGISAFNIVNEYGFEDLARVFREYGEEKYAGRIADKIIEARKNKKIEKTLDLANLINSCYPRFHEEGNAAKRVFQALRIEVNQELKGLYTFICEAVLRLKVGGRAVIISFHSLEDRIVKQAFSYLEKDCICDKKSPICTCNKKSEVRIVTKKPLIASFEEIMINPRAKSAKLRVVERI